MMRIIRSQDHARAFSASDAQRDRRDTARNGIRLPYRERIRLKKLDQREKRRRKEAEMKWNVVVGTLNVGTMTGRGQKVVDVMEKKIDVLCVQKTRWKGQKAREMGNGYKLYYTGEDCKRNGVGIALSPGLKEGVLQVNRESDRLIWMKLAVGNVTVNVVSTYAP